MQDLPLLSLAYGAAFTSGDKAVTFSELERLAPELQAADGWLRTNAAKEEEGFGWINLPRHSVDDVQSLARWLMTRESIVQVGIGGSALGNLMLHNALLPPYWNELPVHKRNAPRFFIADNVDPAENHAIWDLVNPESTAVVVVSKSGSTAETAANFLFFWEKLRDTLGENAARERIVVITDKENGILRPFVEEVGCKSLILPRDVGGRFSVLSCVGLLSAWALGVDARALLAGAREMDDKLQLSNELLSNPAWILASLHYLHELVGRNINVLMPYVDSLERFGEWFAQLWGESLGKNNLGSTPMRALGAIDQHSQIQLYTSGPDDKLYTIVTVAQCKRDIVMPVAPEKTLDKLAYLYGKSMHGLKNFEAEATAAALSKVGRPVVRLELPALDERHLGALIYFYEYVTAVTGYLLQVNPFDQPGVEQGKNYTYGLMGRAGFDAQALEVGILSRSITERQITF